MRVTYSSTPSDARFRVPWDRRSVRIWNEMRREIYPVMLHGNRPVLVHQMGRVGSTTLVVALQQAHLERPILHTHFLSAQGLHFLSDLYAATYGSWKDTPDDQKRHLLRSYVIGRMLSGRKLQIITLIRDPVATNVSGFFHNRALWLSDLQRAKPTWDVVERVKSRFLKCYPHNVPLRWFDDELRTVFDVDVFARPFPPGKGFQVYRGANADVLLLKLEQLEQYGAAACADFLGVSDLVIGRQNSAASYPIGDLHSQFASQVVMPDSYLTSMYESKYATHFYTDQELQTFRERWTQRRALAG